MADQAIHAPLVKDNTTNTLLVVEASADITPVPFSLTHVERHRKSLRYLDVDGKSAAPPGRVLS
jgi:hypothetical protein